MAEKPLVEGERELFSWNHISELQGTKDLAGSDDRHSLFSNVLQWNSPYQICGGIVTVKAEPNESSDPVPNYDTLSLVMGKLHMCRYCNLTFTEKNDLQSHIATHVEPSNPLPHSDDGENEIYRNDAVHMRFVLDEEDDVENVILPDQEHVDEPTEEIANPTCEGLSTPFLCI